MKISVNSFFANNNNYSSYQKTQPIQNSNSRSENSLSFRGKLGDRYLQEILNRAEGASDEPQEEETISRKEIEDILLHAQETGLFLGVVKSANFLDYIEALTQKVISQQTFIKAISEKSENTARKSENRKSEIASRRQELYDKNAALDAQKEELDAMTVQLDERVNAESERIFNEQQNKYELLEKREQALEQRENALDALGVEINAILEKEEKDFREQREQEYAEKDKILDEQSANLDQKVVHMTLSEPQTREDIASQIRILHNVEDPAITAYSNFVEQLFHVAGLVNNHRAIFDKPDRAISLALIDIIKDADGRVPVSMLKFLDNVFKIDEQKIDISAIAAIVSSVRGEDGGVDNEKAAAFIGNYSLKRETIHSTLEFMKQTYYSEPEKEGKQNTSALDKEIEKSKAAEAADKEAEQERLDEIAKRRAVADAGIEEAKRRVREGMVKKINEYRGLFGEQKYNAFIGNDGLIVIDTLGNTFYPAMFDTDNRSVTIAFKHIGTIIGDLSFANCDSGIAINSLNVVNGRVKQAYKINDDSLQNVKRIDTKKQN